jgi:tetratricopeptide (TPR) repeat protein
LYLSLGQTAKAQEQMKQAITAAEALAAQQPNVPDYRFKVAVFQMNFGAMLAKTNQPAEATLRRAIAALEPLVAQQPRRPDFQHALSTGLYNLGVELADTGRHSEALARFRQAIGWERPLLDKQPRNPEFRKHLSQSYGGVARSLQALGCLDDAVEVTRERVKLWPENNADELYGSACAFAICVSIGGDASRKRSLADEAMVSLRAAVSAGYTNAAKMSRDADLVLLHERDDFRQLVANLFDRTFPADAFAR